MFVCSFVYNTSSLMVGMTRGRSTRKQLVLQRTEETCVNAGVIGLRCHLYFTGELHNLLPIILI